MDFAQGAELSRFSFILESYWDTPLVLTFLELSTCILDNKNWQKLVVKYVRESYYNLSLFFAELLFIILNLLFSIQFILNFCFCEA